MITIELGNTYSKVVGASALALLKLDDDLAVETPGYKFVSSYRNGNWDGMTRFLSKSSKGCRFPTGLLTQAYASLKKMGKVELEDTRKEIGYTLGESVELLDKKQGTITLRDYQYDAVKKSLEATRGVINIATNGGKTEIACGLIQSVLPHLQEGETIAFFTSSKEIFNQSYDRLQERLGVPIGRIGDGKWEVEKVNVIMIPTLAKNLSKPKKVAPSKAYKELVEKVSITDPETSEYKEMCKKLHDYEKEWKGKANSNVKKAKDLMKSIVMMIGDEVHHASSDTWYDLFMKLENAYYKFGLTGTVDESVTINITRLYGCTGRIVCKVSNQFLIENGYSAKPTIYMLKVDAEPICKVPYTEARRLGIIECDSRNTTFVNKIVERVNSGKQCLIIVNETEHGEILLDMLKSKVDSIELAHGDKTSKFRKDCLQRLREGSLRVLISTSILDEGVDVSGINCIFLVAGGKSLRQLLQRIGRGLRKKEDGSGVEVYDALDYHNEYLVDHTMERYKTYKSEGFTVIKS